jgi:ribonuclease P protein component
MEFTESLKKNYEFRRLYNKGKSAATPFVVVYVKRTGRDTNRLGITVSNKIGKAVVRNKVRRRLREIYRLHEHEMQKGCDLVFVARGRSVEASYAQLEQAVLKACRQLKVMQEKRDHD